MPSLAPNPAFSASANSCFQRAISARRVATRLPFVAQDLPSVLRDDLVQTIKRISISGVQYKASMLLQNGALVVSPERGATNTY